MWLTKLSTNMIILFYFKQVMFQQKLGDLTYDTPQKIDSNGYNIPPAKSHSTYINSTIFSKL